MNFCFVANPKFLGIRETLPGQTALSFPHRMSKEVRSSYFKMK